MALAEVDGQVFWTKRADWDGEMVGLGKLLLYDDGGGGGIFVAGGRFRAPRVSQVGLFRGASVKLTLKQDPLGYIWGPSEFIFAHPAHHFVLSA